MQHATHWEKSMASSWETLETFLRHFVGMISIQSWDLKYYYRFLTKNMFILKPNEFESQKEQHYFFRKPLF